ncbi:MAG: bifunctional transaldolase/phosoglucose isomerase [Chloroflexi bacterium]|nr:bifunctional transaldolase/phosoglucose isomerase [Chloroflexota bacterium]
MVSPAQAANAAQRLVAQGQSVWLDYISRSLITSGKLEQMVRDGTITGMTSNPTIFEKAVAGSNDYDAELAEVARRGDITPYDAFVEIAVTDIRAAADALRPVYDATHAVDGYVSFELPPGIEHDVEKSVSEAKRLFALIARPNVMIKAPGTPAGVEALRQMIAAGVNANQTLMFSVDVYDATAEAYLAGLEERLAADLPIDRIASVASFFVSRVDTAIDAHLPEGSPLRGKAALANAQRAYGHFLKAFSGPRWERLAAAGAHVQRPLWASTGTKNPAYSDILYVEDLIAPHTVNTMPENTLQAVLDHLDVRPTLVAQLEHAEQVLSGVAAAGVDLAAVTARLLADGLASFEKDFLRLLDRVEAKVALAHVGAPPAAAALGALAPAADRRLGVFEHDKVVQRIWSGDHTVWKPDPTEITDRLGWLKLPETMAAEAGNLQAFALAAAADGLTTAVLLGMGGSSLAPEVLHATFGSAPGLLDLKVLDTTDPAQILAVERAIDLRHTLFIVASKSGGTIETLSHFSYFWEKIPDGRRFAVITDPGSALAKLASERKVRKTFLNPPDIGGRYSALSFFGLVPAALIGVDVARLLKHARDMMHACGDAVPAAQNPGAWLGAAIGEGALAGRDKLTLVLPPATRTLGYWIEQLIAESTGKEGRGIVPIEGEPLGEPAVYGNDRLFAALGDDARLAPLEAAGHPVVRLPFGGDPYQLGAEFFRWEFATAIAGNVLGINPFDQPNVQEAKDATNRILGGDQAPAATDSVADVLASVRAGDYIAITAYLPRDAGTIRELAALRLRLRDKYHVATTVGFGPRFLHSTGQLHKGGANNGVFLQLVTGGDPELTIPGKPFTFGQLKAAQALGDLASLVAHGRRVARTTMAQLQKEV